MGEAVSFPYRLDKLRHSWSARFPLFAAGLSDEFVKARGDKRRGVDLAITFHRRAEQLRYARQNFDGAIFGVAAETNDRGNIQSEFPKCFGQTVGRPKLFLAGHAGAGAKISNKFRLREND